MEGLLSDFDSLCINGRGKYYRHQARESKLGQNTLKCDTGRAGGRGCKVDWKRQWDLPVCRTNCPPPLKSWDKMGLPAKILRNIKATDYAGMGPTPVQAHAFPTIMAGKDLVCCAQTGSGKTAGFLLPVLTWIEAQGGRQSTGDMVAAPYAIIACPTRELARQTADVARDFAKGTGIRCLDLYGGLHCREQGEALGEGCDILVATMGRLLHFCDSNDVTYDYVQFLILDEADRMIQEDGFGADVRKLTRLPGFPKVGARQTLMFSATFPSELQLLAREHLRPALSRLNAFISVGVVGSANTAIDQTVLKVQNGEKFDKALDLLNSDMQSYSKNRKRRYTMKTLIFVKTKFTAKQLQARLTDWDCATMHGDMAQRDREAALDSLISGECAVLVATAVAARGLDIQGVDHVLVYDMPRTVEEYVHMIGRTGRAGKVGRSTAFFNTKSPKDNALRAPLAKILSEAEQEMPGFLADLGTEIGPGDYARRLLNEWHADNDWVF